MQLLTCTLLVKVAYHCLSVVGCHVTYSNVEKPILCLYKIWWHRLSMWSGVVQGGGWVMSSNEWWS